MVIFISWPILIKLCSDLLVNQGIVELENEHSNEFEWLLVTRTDGDVKVRLVAERLTAPVCDGAKNDQVIYYY